MCHIRKSLPPCGNKTKVTFPQRRTPRFMGASPCRTSLTCAVQRAPHRFEGRSDESSSSARHHVANRGRHPTAHCAALPGAFFQGFSAIRRSAVTCAALNLLMIGYRSAAGAFGVGEPDRIEFKSAHLAARAVAKHAPGSRNAIKIRIWSRSEIGHAVPLCRTRGASGSLPRRGGRWCITRPRVIFARHQYDCPIHCLLASIAVLMRSAARCLHVSASSEVTLTARAHCRPEAAHAARPLAPAVFFAAATPRRTRYPPGIRVVSPTGSPRRSRPERMRTNGRITTRPAAVIERGERALRCGHARRRRNAGQALGLKPLRDRRHGAEQLLISAAGGSAWRQLGATCSLRGLGGQRHCLLDRAPRLLRLAGATPSIAAISSARAEAILAWRDCSAAAPPAGR